MNELKDYVDFRLTHSDKLSEAQGYPLELSDCKKHKPMRDLKIYGNSFQDGTPSPETPIEVQSVGELVANETDVNYGKYKIPVVQRGINIADMSVIAKYACVDNGDGTYTLTKGISRQTGNIYPNIQANSVIRVSCSFEHVNTSVEYLPMQIVYANGSQISLKLYNNKIVSTTAATQVDYIRIIMSNSDDDGAYYKFKELMITVDTEFDNYEPYVEPITTNIFLNEPLRKLGDYADYIDFKENKVVRNSKEVVFKGGEIDTVYPYYSDKYGYYLYRTKVNFVNDAHVEPLNSWLTVYPEKSTHFKTNTFRSADTVKINQWTIKTDYALNFTLAPETYASNGVKATAQDINNWLASQYENGTPVTFYYILATQKEEPISLDLPRLIAKTSTIEVDTSLLPSGTYGKYIKS